MTSIWNKIWEVKYNLQRCMRRRTLRMVRNQRPEKRRAEVFAMGKRHWVRADDYGNFEKVGNIGDTLPRNDVQIDTQAGDAILYQGNRICLYYGTNSWGLQGSVKSTVTLLPGFALFWAQEAEPCK